MAVARVRPFGRFAYRYRDRAIVFQVFRCVIARGVPKPLDAEALRWVSARQLGRFRFPPANRALISALQGHYPAML